MELTEEMVKTIDKMLDFLAAECGKLEPCKEGYGDVLAHMEITKLNIMSHYSKLDSIHAEKHIGKIQAIQNDLLNRYRDATAM
jgi:NADH:ubiquinone oxidoreductase subunit F (NADH-binding)